MIYNAFFEKPTGMSGAAATIGKICKVLFKRPTAGCKSILSMDFDGTIANTEQLHAESYGYCLRGYGIMFKEKDMFKYLGKPESDILEMLSMDYNIKIEAESFSNKRNAYVSGRITELKPYSFISLIIDYAKDSGWLVLVLSSQKELIIKRCLEAWEMSNKIDQIISIDSSRKDKKYYLVNFCGIFNTTKENIVIVEDDGNIIKVAHSMGYKTIGIIHQLNQSRDITADYVIDVR